MRWPGSVKSASTVSLSSSRIWVPTGTRSTRSRPFAALGAGLVGAGAATAFLGTKMLLITVVDQRVQIVRRLEHDVAALAAIAAIRPAELDELLAAKAHGAAAAITALQIDLGLVEEFHWSP